MSTKQRTHAEIDCRIKRVVDRVRQLQQLGFNWVQINNALFGPSGEIMRHFPDREERLRFLRSPAVNELHAAIAEAEMPESIEDAQETSGRVLVRMPKSLHAALLAEAESEGVSLNQLIVSKLSVGLKSIV